MYLPTTYSHALILMGATMLAWGSWANMAKIDKKWRFELFYWDFAIGVLVAALIFGATLGSSSFIHGVKAVISAKSFACSPIYALFAGAIFNLANILLIAAISIAGMAVAFPIAIGMALLLGTLLSYLILPSGLPYLLFSGVFFILLAIILDGFAYSLSDGATKKKKRGIGICLFSGLLMSLFYPLLTKSMNGVDALSPYVALFLFALGLFFSNLIMNPVFMMHPPQGTPLRARDYFRGNLFQHLWGFLGGAIWCTGMTFNVLAASVAGPAASYAFGQGATLVAAMWGVFVWKEFKSKSHRLITAMFLCYLIGLVLIGFAR